VTIENGDGFPDDPAIYTLHNHGAAGLCEKTNGLMTGQNSGFQAINLAVLAGAKRIALLGYDMKATGGKAHWFGDHPIQTAPSVFSAMINNFPSLVKPLGTLGVEVLNCTPGSALECFPKRALESVLPDPAAAALPA
jgi:hypothetical protein